MWNFDCPAEARISRPAALALLTALVLGGCASVDTGQYNRPHSPTKEAWSKTEGSPAQTIVAEWWTGFDDPYLDELIQRAIAGSLELRILAARVDAAAIGVETEVANNRPKIALESASGLSRTNESTTQSYGADITGVNWEVDLWGKVRKGIRAEQAAYRASEADYRAGYLVVVSEVAAAYFQIRQLDEQLAQQQTNLEQAKRTLAIYASQYEEGLVAETKVLQQRAELRNSRQQKLDLERQRLNSENRLAALLGTPAGDLKVPRSRNSSLRPLAVPAGLPSDLLARRPDIVAAEYRVLQAHEVLGQAKLAKLPSVNLTGSGGVASNALSTLLGSWTLGLGAAIKFPIFDPTLDLKIEANTVQKRIAEDEYRSVVIKSFEEVENALADLASRREQQRILEQRISELSLVNRTVHAQLEEGLVSQLQVFESDRTLLAARQSLSEINHQMLKDTVTLYKAMGGGWPAESVRQADAS